jgi:uncharacterized membrane protein YdjX (TVP38/TMEM64 family)
MMSQNFSPQILEPSELKVVTIFKHTNLLKLLITLLSHYNMKKISHNDKIKFSLLVLIVIIIISFFSQILELFMNSEEFIRSYGSFAPLVYAFLIILGILIAPIPTSPLVIIAGALFGPWKAIIYTLMAATVGSTLAFLIGRFFLRNYFKNNFENHTLYKKLKGKNDKNIAYSVFIFHLLPQVSFDLVSYLAGATSLNIFVYMLLTFTAMIPVVFILSFFGAFLEPYKEIVLVLLGLSALLYIGYHAIKENRRK